MDSRSILRNKSRFAAVIVIVVLIAIQSVLLVADSCGSCAAPDDGSSRFGLNGDKTKPNVDISYSDAQAPSDQDENKVVIVPMLINNDHIMSESFKPTNLVEIGDEVKGTPTIQMNATAFAAYKLMYKDIKAAGVTTPSVISAYRSYSKQKQLYDAKVKQYGAGQKVTAVPGSSEHQYSASVDISTDGTCQNNFGELDIGIWVAQNSYKYGFVIRYPSDKKDITGINFEPWHLRYVGVEHATAMHELNMCLEEYVDYLRATYPNTVNEQSPDDFPAPRFPGDTQGVSMALVPPVSDSSVRPVSNSSAE